MALVEEFKQSHLGFYGLKVIYVAHRGSDETKILKAFQTFKDFQYVAVKFSFLPLT